MSTEILRRAADQMAHLLSTVNHPAPWRERREGQWEWSVIDADGDDITWTETDHIAAWDPQTAESVVNLLIVIANNLDSGTLSLDDPIAQQAFDLAVTFLRQETSR
jgi:hypothetical protein